MKKVIFKYDGATGNIYDSNMVCLGTYLGANPFDEVEIQPSKEAGNVESILKLKAAGFEMEDILQMKAHNLL